MNPDLFHGGFQEHRPQFGLLTQELQKAILSDPWSTSLLRNFGWFESIHIDVALTAFQPVLPHVFSDFAKHTMIGPAPNRWVRRACSLFKPPLGTLSGHNLSL